MNNYIALIRIWSSDEIIRCRVSPGFWNGRRLARQWRLFCRCLSLVQRPPWKATATVIGCEHSTLRQPEDIRNLCGNGDIYVWMLAAGWKGYNTLEHAVFVICSSLGCVLHLFVFSKTRLRRSGCGAREASHAAAENHPALRIISEDDPILCIKYNDVFVPFLHRCIPRNMR